MLALNHTYHLLGYNEALKNNNKDLLNYHVAGVRIFGNTDYNKDKTALNNKSHKYLILLNTQGFYSKRIKDKFKKIH